MEPYVSIELGGAPRGKGAHRSRIGRKNGKPFVMTYPDPNDERYRESLAMKAKVQMMGMPLITTEVRLEILAFYAVPKSWSNAMRGYALDGLIRPGVKPDWDNVGKMVGDSFKRVVWTDDARVVEGSVRKFYALQGGIHVDVYRGMSLEELLDLQEQGLPLEQ